MSTNIPTDAQLNVADSEGKYIFVHPETNTNQVIDKDTGKTLKEIIGSGAVGSPIPNSHFIIRATTNKQTIFTFTDNEFDIKTSEVMVHLNGEFLYKNDEYSVSTGTNGIVTIITAQEIDAGNTLHVTVDYKRGTSSDSSLTVKDRKFLDLPAGIIEIYIDGTNGSDNNDGLTFGTAFKTLTFASDYINKTFLPTTQLIIKICTGVYVNQHLSIYSGSYVLVTTHNGDVTMRGTIESSGMVTNIRLNNITSAKVSPRAEDKLIIEANPINVTTNLLFYSIDLSYCGVAFVSPNVTVDCRGFTSGKVYGDRNVGILVGYNTSAEIRGAVKGAQYPLFITNNGRCNLFGASLDGGIVYITTGSILTKTTNMILDNVTYQSNQGGIYLNEALNGTIIESGENANGSFIKFANGDLIMKKLVNHNYVTANQLVSIPVTMPFENFSMGDAIVTIRDMDKSADVTINTIAFSNTWVSGAIKSRIINFKASYAQVYTISVVMFSKWK